APPDLPQFPARAGNCLLGVRSHAHQAGNLVTQSGPDPVRRRSRADVPGGVRDHVGPVLRRRVKRVPLRDGPLRPCAPGPFDEETTMPEAVIVSAVRTPIGTSYKGTLREMLPEELATLV